MSRTGPMWTRRKPTGLAVGLGLAAAATLTVMPASTDRTADFDERALRRILQPPRGIPAVPLPPDNPPSAAKVRLGRKLFLDRRLSGNGTLSCAMCHVPEQGFTVHEIRTAVGNRGKSLRRNAPTLLNVAYAGPFFHDGRQPALDLQPFDVFLNPDEMAAPSLGALVARVRSLPDYRSLFVDAFGAPADVDGIGRALGTYLRSLLAADSPFDRWHFGEDPEAMSESAQRGFALFAGKARCISCHLIDDEHALFTDHEFHDTGLGWFHSNVRMTSTEPVSVELAPGVHTQIPRSVVNSVGDPPADDLGRYESTGNPADRWLFKTPILRNVALTAPYMHDGSLSTLAEVVEFYDGGGHPHEGLDPDIQPLGLRQQERGDLVEFLHQLTGTGIDELIADARSEKVGNPDDVKP